MFKWLITLFIAIIVLGLFVPGLSRWFPLGRLPGDVHVRWRGRMYSFPFASSLLLSLLLGLILRLL